MVLAGMLGLHGAAGDRMLRMQMLPAGVHNAADDRTGEDGGRLAHFAGFS